MPATTLVIKILADASQAASTMKRSSESAGKFASGVKSAAVPALAVVGALGLMAKAGAEDAAAQATLAKSLQNTAHATSAQVAATEDWIAKTAMATGVADDQLRPALATLARATGDVSKSQDALKIAMDVSAATGKDLETVSAAIAKGYSGQTGALGKLGIGISKATLKSGDMGKIMAEVARKTQGQAATAAETAAGKYRRMVLAFDETKESVGTALLPALTSLANILAKVGNWAQTHAGAVQFLAVALGAVAVAVLLVNVSMTILAANPIVLAVIGITLAVAGLVALLVLAYKKSTTFRTIVQTTFAVVSAWAQFMWSVLKPIFALIIAYYRLLWTGAVFMKDRIVAAWKVMQAAIMTVWVWIKTNVIDRWLAGYRMIWQAAEAMRDRAKAAWADLKTSLKAAWDWIDAHVFGPFRTAIDNIKSALDKIKVPSWLSSVVGKVTGSAARAPAPAPTVRGVGATRTVAAAPAGAAGSGWAPVFHIHLDGDVLRDMVRSIVVEEQDTLARRIVARRP